MDRFIEYTWLRNFMAAAKERLSQSRGELVFDSSLQRELESVIMGDGGIDPSRVIMENRKDVD